MAFKFFLIPAVVLSILYGFAMASMAHAEYVIFTEVDWSAECALVDDSVECDISSDSGIMNVHVFMNAGIGDVTVLDQDFRGCPTEVHVSLDPVVMSVFSEMDVTTCELVNPCEDCTLEVCLPDMKCDHGLPDSVGSRPEPLPLKFEPAKSPAGPKAIARLTSYVAVH